MSDANVFKEKDAQLKAFEFTANADLQQNQTELAYRDLNSTFFNLEKETKKGADLKNWERTHKERKTAIERTWHQNAETTYKELTKGATGNKKSRAYYRNYSLKELEVFIKQSDRGGNSDEYNNVATNLELYNRIMEKGNPLEGFGILLRLKENADTYVGSRNSPNSTKGKIRKAIISVIAEKTTALVEEQRNEYKTKADTLFAEIQNSDVTDEKVNEAFKAHYNLMYQVLNGNIELSPEELAKLDSNTEAVLQKVMTQKVDESQGNNMSTKFFNSLGWSANDARLVKEADLEENGKEYKKSPLKKKMYHSINPYGENKDAVEAGKQLAGVKKKDNRLFFGLGRFGKGIYTSAKDDNPKSTDQKAEDNSWGYGDKIGAVQLVIMVNEHARMISYTDFMKKQEKEFDKKFKKVSKLLQNEKSSKTGYRDFLTMKAAFFGYNTLKDPTCGISGVDYYVTTDRKALSIINEMRVRKNENDTSFDAVDYVQLKKEA
ncbi:MAG: hypothetical protein K6G24_03150 [Lachnospiraceae bacterium]|nr:hypothetical protein [Lachnospiraceae bacterium]